MNFHEAIAFAKKTKGARITCTFWKQCDGLKDLFSRWRVPWPKTGPVPASHPWIGA